ncbi:MAG: rhodanese-like domain-containing protein [Bradymonadales bacterium]|jgi:phage shock protein E
MPFFKFFKSKSTQCISPSEAKELMAKEGVIVVDVRRADEYAEKHIPGAILIPNESIQGKEPAELKDKDATILVHCRSGARSAAACEKLSRLGYTKVYDFGGILSWPYETERGAYKKR